MRILMTGGAGYVGSACLRWSLRKGHDVVAYDDLSAGNAAAVPSDRLIVGSIEDRDALVRAMREHRIEAVMHFAAVASVPESIEQPELYWRINLLGTKNVLDAMRECGVQRLVFSSTAATYAFENTMPLTETSRVAPEVPYGKSKLAAEEMIRDYTRAYGMGHVILRYFNASGADTDGQFGEHRREETHLIPLVLYAASGRRGPLQIYGDDWDTRDGTCVRDYVHTEDLAQAHQLAVEKMEPGHGRVFNVGSGRGATVLEVLHACEEVVGRPIPREVAGRREGDPAVLIASSERLIRELGWKPRYTEIRDIVATVWEWCRNHPNGYAERA
ncbi:MAG TPA: UDP-glucose 4-epimerase GalE [Myxococcota bacterium]